MAIDPVTEPVAPKPRSKSLAYLWLPLVGLSVIGSYASVLIPAIAGERPQQENGASVLLINVLFFCLLWKYRQRRVWIGALVGISTTFLVLFAAGFITALNRVH